jgi:hypothetical protein
VALPPVLAGTEGLQVLVLRVADLVAGRIQAHQDKIDWLLVDPVDGVASLRAGAEVLAACLDNGKNFPAVAVAVRLEEVAEVEAHPQVEAAEALDNTDNRIADSSTTSYIVHRAAGCNSWCTHRAAASKHIAGAIRHYRC